jgi:hypothetical protein
VHPLPRFSSSITTCVCRDQTTLRFLARKQVVGRPSASYSKTGIESTKSREQTKAKRKSRAVRTSAHQDDTINQHIHRRSKDGLQLALVEEEARFGGRLLAHLIRPHQKGVEQQQSPCIQQLQHHLHNTTQHNTTQHNQYQQMECNTTLLINNSRATNNKMPYWEKRSVQIPRDDEKVDRTPAPVQQPLLDLYTRMCDTQQRDKVK